MDFLNHFSANIWCDVTGSQVIGPFVPEELLTSERYFRFLDYELPVLLDVPPIAGDSCDCRKMAHPVILVGT
jgi:hypothetical protein